MNALTPSQLALIDEIDMVMKDLKFMEENFSDNKGWQSETFNDKTIVSYK